MLTRRLRKLYKVTYFIKLKEVFTKSHKEVDGDDDDLDLGNGNGILLNNNTKKDENLEKFKKCC